MITKPMVVVVVVVVVVVAVCQASLCGYQ